MAVATRDTVAQAAFRFALEPTPAQERMFFSHAGAARTAYNWGVAQVAAALDARKAQVDAGVEPDVDVPNHFDLCKQWTAHKDTYADAPDGRGRTFAWVGENFVGTYQAALRDAAKAWSDFFASRRGDRAGRRLGRPRFKAKGRARDSFQLHGPTLRMADRSHIVLPKVGVVKVPGRVRVGRGTTQWADRNARPARRLARLIVKAAAAGPATCPGCAGAGTVVVKTKKDGDKERRCPSCRGAEVVPRARIVRATVSRGASGTWWCSVTAVLVRQLPAAVPGSVVTWAGGRGTVDMVVADGLVPGVGSAQGKPPAVGTRAAPVARVRRGDGRLVAVPVAALAVPTRRQRAAGPVGVDLGVKHLAVVSDGRVFNNPRHLAAALAVLRAQQKALSRASAGSRRRAAAQRRVGTTHERVALARKDALDRITTLLAGGHDVIAVEGWDAQAMAERGSAGVPRHVRAARNRALADAAPGMFRWQAEYKTALSGQSRLIKTAPGDPTGRTCSRCAQVRDKPVPPAEELFRCGSCGWAGDRRANTAAVLAGRAAASGAVAVPVKPRGGGVRPGVPVSAGRAGRPSAKRAARARSPGPGSDGHL